MFKKMRSRKFFVLILFIIVTWTGYFITLGVDPTTVLSPAVFIAIMSTQAFFGAAYIGGNVFQKYIEMRTGKTSEPKSGAAKLMPMTGSALDRIKAKGQ